MSLYKELAYDNGDIDTISGVQFCVMSPDDIRSRSVVEVTNQTYSHNEPVHGGLFDRRMGVVEHNVLCQTCEQKNNFCPGHFGHIELARPVFHVHFFEYIRKLLRCICFRCSRVPVVLADSPEIRAMQNKRLSRQKRWELMYKLLSKIKKCPHCGMRQPDKVGRYGVLRIEMEWRTGGVASTSEDAVVETQPSKVVLGAEDVLRMFRRMTDDDIGLLGFCKTQNRPEWMICTVLLVPPPAVRPTVKNETGQRQEDDLTTKLISIVKINAQVKLKMEKGLKEQADNVYKLLQYEVATLIDNNIQGIPPSAVIRTGRPIRALTERLKSKEGRIRGNLMGKRVDFSARSVITPDPNISIDELGVPHRIAMNLTMPEVVNKWTLERLQKLVANGPAVYPGAKLVRKTCEGCRTVSLKGLPDLAEVAANLQHGDIVERHLCDGDVVLFNRQPSLHKMSMMGHKVRVMPYNTFRLNVCVTPNFNADFDGDEMNMHVPQSMQTHEELLELASVMNQIISPRECKPIISVVQDIALGIFRMTRPGMTVSPRQLMNLMAPKAQYAPVPRALAGARTSGHDLLSTVIPRGIWTTSQGVVVADGRIQPNSKPVNKKVYQDQSNGLVHTIHNDLGKEATRQFFDDTQKLVCDFLVLDGFSVGISDLVVSQGTRQGFRDVVKVMRSNVDKMVRSVHDGTFENTSNKTPGEFFETEVNKVMNDARSDIGKLASAEVGDKDNRLISMVNAGSKGSEINVAQMVGCVGQVNVDGKRIPYGFDNRTLPHYTRYDDGPESRGFVRNSFIGGLTPQEFFFHSMGGREGLIDTAVKTSETGYIQRKLVKAMEDFKIHHDGTVRNAAGTIIQFLYGEDGMDPIKVERQKVPHLFYGPAAFDDAFLLGDAELAALGYAGADLETARGLLRVHLDDLVAEKEFIISDMFRGKVGEIEFPVNVQRILNSSNSTSGPAWSTLPDPIAHVLDAVAKVLSELRVNHANGVPPVFRFILNAALSPKPTFKASHGPDVLDKVLTEVVRRFKDSIADASEMVGVVAAQSISEPTTQLSIMSGMGVLIQRGLNDDSGMYYGPVGALIDNIMLANKGAVVDLGGGSSVLDLVGDGKDMDLRIVGVSSDDEKTSWRRVSQVSRHPANGGMVRIKTRSGKKVTATLSHSFLKRTERGIAPVLGSELSLGDRVPVARVVPQPPRAVSSVRIGQSDIALNRDFGWLCGAYVADGNVVANTISISKVIPEYQDKLRAVFSNFFNLEMRQNHKQGQGELHGWDMSKYFSCNNIVSSASLSRFMLDSFDTGSFDKRLPGWVYAADLDFVKGLLCGYFDGDGNVNGDGPKSMIRSGSVSEKLTEDMLLLLTRVGIFASKCVEKHLAEPGRNDIHTIQIARKYARTFRDQVGPMVVQHKAESLEEIIAYVERDDAHSTREEIDMIPELGDVLAAVGKALRMPGQSRLYKRFQKKEAIGRETLRTFVGDFERTLEERYAEAQAQRVEFSGKFDGMRAAIAGARSTTGAVDGRGVMDAKEDMLRELCDARTRLLGNKALGAANLITNARNGRITASLFESHVEKLDAAADAALAAELLSLDDVRDDKLPALRSALEADVVWDEIVEIERLPDPGEMVYDFTVPGNDSFMVDCGVLVHNTLNTFHLSGVASASSQVRGVPRLKEIIDCTASKNIKTPVMNVHFDASLRHNKTVCIEMMNRLRMIRFRDVVSRSRIYFDPAETIGAPSHIDQDSLFIELYSRFDALSQKADFSPWVLRLEFDRQKMHNLSLTMADLDSILLEFFDEKVSCVFSDDNAAELAMRVRLVTSSQDSDDLMTELKALEHNVLDVVPIRGIERIESVLIRETLKTQRYDVDKKLFEPFSEFVVDTDGSNLVAALGVPGVDSVRTTTNDVYEVFYTLGVEAARQKLHDEIIGVLDSTYINYRHVALLVDAITNKGTLVSVNRHGINQGDNGPLAKCSFEETVERLVKAGIFSERDKVNGVSANIMLGQVAPCGTGDSKILVDAERLPAVVEDEAEAGEIVEGADDEEAEDEENEDEEGGPAAGKGMFDFDLVI